MDTPEPIFDIAHLGHIELLTDKPQESLDFFVEHSRPDGERPRGRQRLSARL